MILASSLAFDGLRGEFDEFQTDTSIGSADEVRLRHVFGFVGFMVSLFILVGFAPWDFVIGVTVNNVGRNSAAQFGSAYGKLCRFQAKLLNM